MRLLAPLLALAFVATSLSAATINVTSNADIVAADTVCTLREALLSANGDIAVGGCVAGAGNDQIFFSIGPAPTYAQTTITLTAPLPPITAPVFLNGFTQTQPSDVQLRPRIILDGQNLVPSGLVVEQSGGGSVIQRLAFVRFTGPAIVLQASDNEVMGNYIGITPPANAPGPNGSGILVLGLAGAPASNNEIGRSGNSFDPNVISGNLGDGIVIRAVVAGAADGNLLGRNDIGVNPSTFGPIPNGGNGMVLENATDTLIDAQVIFASGANGVHLLGAQRTRIQRSSIGQEPGTGNTLSGIRIESSAISPANDNVIGGNAVPDIINRIRYNGASGIRIVSGTGNRIFGTALHENTPLNIDLGPAGETPNDTCDVDTGANLLQNKPTITSIVYEGGNVTIAGRLDSAATGTYTLEFYATRVHAVHPVILLGSTNVNTTACSGAFSVTFPAATPYLSIVATATDAAGNTSEQGGLVVAPAVNSDVPLASPLTLATLAVMLAAAGFIASRAH